MSRIESILNDVFEQAGQKNQKGKVVAAALRDIVANDPIKELTTLIASLPKGSVHFSQHTTAGVWTLQVKMHNGHKDVVEAQDADFYKLARKGVAAIKAKQDLWD